MKFVSTARVLQDAFRLLRLVVERRNTYPVLGCVRFDGNQLAVTDLDMELSLTVPVQQASGEAAIYFRQLASLVACVPPDETVTITTAGERARVLFSAGAYDLGAMPAEQFPITKEPEAPAIAKVADSGFRDALRFVSPAISTEDTRYYLNGVCFSRNASNEPVVVATDGYRMAVHPAAGLGAIAAGQIVPRKAVRVLLQMPEPQTIEVSESRIRFTWPGGRLTSKLIEGKFQDWGRVLPKIDDMSTAITLPRAPFDQSLRRQAMLHSSDCPSATLAFQGHRAVLVMDDSEARGREFLPPVSTVNTDEARTIGFNARYMRDMLRLFRDETVTIAQENVGAPMRITGTNSAFAVLIPMRTSNDTMATDTLREVVVTEVGRVAA